MKEDAGYKRNWWKRSVFKPDECFQLQPITKRKEAMTPIQCDLTNAPETVHLSTCPLVHRHTWDTKEILSCQRLLQ